MRRHFFFKKLIAMSVIVCLTACGTKQDAVNITEVVTRSDTDKTSMLAEPDISYEVPEVYSLISVDKSGYEASDKKIAVIAADNLPARFEIVNDETGEAVYTGNIKKADISEADEKNTGYAEFSDFSDEGTYHIEADIIGCSEAFTIKSGLYHDLITDAFAGLDTLRCERCHSGMLPLESDASTWVDVSGGWHTGENGQKDVVDGCVAALDLMLAYEYYKNSFKDDMGIAESKNGRADILDEIIYELDWLFKMQNSQTGGVYTSVSVQKLSGSDNERLVVGGETTKATAYFCTAMARFSYLYGPVDRAYASQCMKAANKAWKCLEANKDIVSKEQMYRAAVEMYRATGYRVYSDVIEEFLKDSSSKVYDNRLMLDAAITYLDTPRYTDKAQCTELMAAFMDKTEAHAGLAGESRYLVEPGDKTTKELLRNACELVVVDYIISSSEYAKIEKNYLHFIGGRNEQGIVSLTYENDPDSYAELIMVLGRLISK